MNPILRSKKVRFLIVVVVIIFVFQLTSGCFTFRMSPSEVDKYFADAEQKPKMHQYQMEGRTINYAEIGTDHLPTVIFFHGSPGSWSAFVDFMKDQSFITKVKVVSVDRPGFGYSDFGNSVESLQKQAELLKPVLERYKATGPNILVGHSLGGSLIAQMATDYPELCDALVLVAPSIDPELEPNEDWFRYPLRTPFFSWLLPTSFAVSNDEIYFLEEDLQKLEPQLSQIKIPVTVIQGQEDFLVPPGNADFVKEKFTNAPVEVILKENMNHFIPWNHPEMIKQAVLKYSDLQK